MKIYILLIDFENLNVFNYLNYIKVKVFKKKIKMYIVIIYLNIFRICCIFNWRFSCISCKNCKCSK